MQITSNIAELIKEMTDFEKKQIPYASQVALNNTAEIAMKAVSKSWDREYHITGAWNKVGGQAGIKKRSANKKHLENWVDIYVPEKNTWLADHEGGALRDGTQLIPTKYFKLMFPTIVKNAAIKKKARLLLNNKSKYKMFEAKIKGKSYFMMRLKGRKEGKKLYRNDKGQYSSNTTASLVNGRYGKNGRVLKQKKVQTSDAVPLFLIKRGGVKIKDTSDFNVIIKKVFEKNLDKQFDRALEYAMFTAKKR